MTIEIFKAYADEDWSLDDFERLVASWREAMPAEVAKSGRVWLVGAYEESPRLVMERDETAAEVEDRQARDAEPLARYRALVAGGAGA